MQCDTADSDLMKTALSVLVHQVASLNCLYHQAHRALPEQLVSVRAGDGRRSGGRGAPAAAGVPDDRQPMEGERGGHRGHPGGGVRRCVPGTRAAAVRAQGPGGGSALPRRHLPGLLQFLAAASPCPLGQWSACAGAPVIPYVHQVKE